MKTKTAVIASVLAISAVWMAGNYRDTPDRPSDLRDAVSDTSVIDTLKTGVQSTRSPAPVPGDPDKAQSWAEEVARELRKELTGYGVKAQVSVVEAPGKKPYLAVQFSSRGDYTKVKALFYQDSDSPSYMGVAVRPSVVKTADDIQAKAAAGPEQVLLKLRTEDGGEAELLGNVSVRAPYLVAFDDLRVRMNGRKYRIGAGSIYLEEICRPYAGKYPYTYERVQTKGLLERSVFIGRDHNVITKSYQGDNIVVWDGACQREPY